jgi:hypothetical protein
MDSDTDVMVLPFLPSARDAEPVTIQAADEARRLVDKLEGTLRALGKLVVECGENNVLWGTDSIWYGSPQ